MGTSKKKKEEKWLQVGNYLLGVDSNTNGSYVVLKTVNGQWTIKWKDDCLMYASMLNMMGLAVNNDKVKDYLHSLVTIMFVTTTYMHDLTSIATRGTSPVFEGIAKLVNEQAEYENSLVEEATKKKDEEALKEVGDMEAAKEELEKSKKGE